MRSIKRDDASRYRKLLALVLSTIKKSSFTAAKVDVIGREEEVRDTP